MRFSVSATNRKPRIGEVDGQHYYFLDDAEFSRHIDAGDFLEFEEVYPGRFYGTLRSEIDRICGQGHNCILDIDVKGAVNVRNQLGDRAISIFIKPPCVEALRERLTARATDSPEEIEKRVGKAAEEIGYAPKFDFVIVNDVLDKAVAEVDATIKNFLKQ